MTPQEYLDWCRDMSERLKKYEYHFTNADRIRSMTDEELADLLSGENIYPWCLKEPCPEECRECILSWLKEEEET